MRLVQLLSLSLFMSIVYSPNSFGAVLSVENGVLLGATGINVNGSLFDVAFRDGTCEELFNGCDENSDFIFNGDLALGLDANAALMEQVFIDTSLGAFDSNPSLTNGCLLDACQTNTPVFLSGGGGSLGILWVFNRELETRDIATGSGSALRGIDTGLQDAGNYAVWSQSMTAVPVPAAVWMFISGLLGMAGIARRN